MGNDFLLSDEEIKFLYKGILRWHKEHGTLENFKRQKYTKERIFKTSSLSFINDHLIEAMWGLYNNKVLGNDKLYPGIRSSIAYLNFIDYIEKANSVNIECIVKRIIEGEFAYINNIISAHNPPLKIDDETINKINELWNKYSKKYKITPTYENIPYKKK